MRRTSDLESIARRSLLLLILLLSVTVGGSEAAGIEPVLRIVGPTEPLLFFAWSIANAGDFNGDGYDDLVVHGSSETIPAHGRVYFGGPAADAVEDILLLQDPGLYVSHPVEVATAGDMNGDGFSDIVVPTPSSPIHGGQARIYFGGRIPDGVADLRLRDITFDFLSFPAENAAAADFNGDGFDDVLLGAPGYVDQNENFEDTKGRAYLFLGGATPDGDPDLIFESPSNQAVGEYFIRFGGVVAPAGDLNGDAFGDFLVAPRGGPYPLGFAKAFVYLGGARLDSIPDASIITEPESDQRGRGPVMTAAGDLNADGLNDVAMLAKVDNTRHDPVHVFFGKGAMTLDRSPDIALVLPDGGNPTSVLGGRDVNGDGQSDLIVGSAVGSTVYVYFGGPAFDSSPDITLTQPDTWLGTGLAFADWTADGVSDLIVSAMFLGRQGEVYIYDLADPLHAHVLTAGERRPIPIADAAPAPLRLRFEPLDGSYSSADVNPASIRLRSDATGEVSEISAITSKATAEGDWDRNGVTDLLASFSGADLARLFSNVVGRKTVDVTLDGRLRSRRRFAAPVSLTIVATGPRGDLTAAVQPNPLNPRGTLSFRTEFPGPVTARLFDLHGRCVRTLMEGATLNAGEHRIQIDGQDDAGRVLASGVYFYRIDSPDGPARGRLVVAK